MKRLFYVACAALAAAILYFLPSPKPTGTGNACGGFSCERPQPSSQSAVVENKENRAEWVGISILRSNLPLDGGVVQFVFRLRSRVEFDVKDILVKCTYSGLSGTVLGVKTRIIYETLKKGADRKSSQITFGFVPFQTQDAHCLALSADRV